MSKGAGTSRQGTAGCRIPIFLWLLLAWGILVPFPAECITGDQSESGAAGRRYAAAAGEAPGEAPGEAVAVATVQAGPSAGTPVTPPPAVRPAHPSSCGLQPMHLFPQMTARDTNNLKSKDGAEIDLGLVPLAPDDPALLAELRRLIATKAVTLWHERPAASSATTQGGTPTPHTDRYGRLRGHLTIGRDSGEWLQQALIEKGLAQVRLPFGLPPGPCTRRLLVTEALARQKARGHWATGRFRVFPADRSDALLALRGRFAIVEGRIRRIARSRNRNRRYLNFGRDWRRDFTVRIDDNVWRKHSPEADQQPADKQNASGSLATLAVGMTVRIRGWIEDRRGPLIDVRDLSQIEIIPDARSRPGTAR